MTDVRESVEVGFGRFLHNFKKKDIFGQVEKDLTPGFSFNGQVFS